MVRDAQLHCATHHEADHASVGGVKARSAESTTQSALAAARGRRHSGAMANKNAFAIVAIALALIVGVIVGVGIVGTILLFLYGIVVSVFRNAFGIELPYPF